MAEVSTVEFNSEVQKYMAIFSNGDTCILDSDNLRDAEREAERVAEQTSFASFSAPRIDWK